MAVRGSGWALALAAAAALLARPAPAQTGDQGRGGWTATWAAAQLAPQPHESLPAESLGDATLRQIVRVSVGGTRVRVRLSNAFGTTPLRLDAVHLARAAAPGTSRIERGTDRALRFGGETAVVIPPGADYLSDPVAMAVPARAHLALSFHLAQAPAWQTGHPGSRTTSFLARGNHVAAAALPAAIPIVRWYFVAGVEVEAPSEAIVVLGDSITDGYGTTTDGDDRWTDVLGDRLQASPETRRLAVLNLGIGGNRLLLDGLGPNALARIDRDVLSPPGVRHLLVLVGVNDLGTLTRDRPASAAEHAALVRAMIAGYGQIVSRARAHGIRVIGATITPFGGSDYYHPDAANEADRQAVNRWIRTGGAFDAVVDFDAVLRDPARPDRLAAAFDSGDHLHPSRAGYRAMGEAVPLALFR